MTKGINDMATNPSDPSIIASAADDTTVRVWSLAAVHKKQPCVALLAGEGHSWDLLSVVCTTFLPYCSSGTSPTSKTGGG